MMRPNIRLECSNLAVLCLQAPGLAVVLVGSRGDSETYVRSKKKACEEIGIKSFGTDLDEDVSQEELLKVHTAAINHHTWNSISILQGAVNR